MDAFLQKYAPLVIGSLSGFDRLIFHGTLRSLAYVEGMRAFLNSAGVLLKDFKTYVERVTAHVIKASEATARRLARPIVYLDSPKTDKGLLARQIAQQDRIERGLIAVFSAVELCRSYKVVANRATKRLELRLLNRKCLHLYHYYLHDRFGLIHLRLQTWFPFNLQVWINGREWLCRDLERARLDFRRHDNKILWVEDFQQAQKLFDAQLRLRWPHQLDALARLAHPAHDQLFPSPVPSYYWSAHQSEWATDIAFRNRASLQRLMPQLIHQAILHFGACDVLRFLGRPLPALAPLPKRFAGDLLSDLKGRHEGWRIKHCVDGNSLKLYDHFNILRTEATTTQPRAFRVFRPTQTAPRGPRAWRPMRKGVADLHRRAQVSQAANGRYLEALAAVPTGTPLKELIADICRPTRLNGRRVRALHPWGPGDARLLEAIGRGEFLVNGFRNRQIRDLLYPDANASAQNRRRRSAQVTRLFRLLRGHHLIRKVPRTHRYQVTNRGRLIVNTILSASHARAEDLIKKAA